MLDPRPNRALTVLVHILAWASLATLAGLARFEHAVKPGDSLTDPEDLGELLGWLLLVGYFYVHHLTLAPRLFFRGRRLAYAAAVAAGLALVIALPVAITTAAAPLLTEAAPPRERALRVAVVESPTHSAAADGEPSRAPHGSVGARRSPGLAREYAGFVLLFGVSTLGSLVYLSQARLREREAAARRGELAQLHAQARPHFLFNALNGVYGLALEEEAPRTADALLRVSGFLRYAAGSADRERVPFARELGHLSDYVALQRLRFGDTVRVRFDGERDGDDGGPGDNDGGIGTAGESLLIAPLLLLTFVENAFKHGVNPEYDSWVHIALSITDGHLRLRVVNSRHPDAPQAVAASGGGTGLSNARRRLELLYPGRHTLLVDAADPARFAVDLTLELDPAT